MSATALGGHQRSDFKLVKIPGGYKVVRIEDGATLSIPVIGAPTLEQLKARNRDGTLFPSPQAPVQPIVRFVEPEGDLFDRPWRSPGYPRRPWGLS